MYKKLCSRCRQPSFSSCESGKWICPICQNDLTHIAFQDAVSRHNNPQLKLIVNHTSEKTTQATFIKFI